MVGRQVLLGRPPRIYLRLRLAAPLTAPEFALAFSLARILLAGQICGADVSMNLDTRKRPVYAVVVDISDNEYEIIESGLTRKEAELASAAAMQLLQQVRVVRQSPVQTSDLEPDVQH
jgi:hypothetical protein